ncbi:hypothetical protein M885DRAFT_95578 [Pelagophyceae sp. CCMP2097]|nr:hypothetical protein M885DRAFT_95578 [Pelagophyceae sp. CCMP2097]
MPTRVRGRPRGLMARLGAARLRAAVFVAVARCGAGAPTLQLAGASTVCAYDPLVARWVVPGALAADTGENAPYIGLFGSEPRGAALPAAFSKLRLALPAAEVQWVPRELYSEARGPAADSPTAASMLWHKETWTLSVEFSERTSAPHLEDAKAVERVLHLRPAPRFAKAHWEQDGLVLVLHLNAPDDVEAVDAAFHAQTFTATPAPWPPPAPPPEIVEGAESMRVGLPGVYWLGLVHGGTLAAPALRVDVEACEGTVMHDFSTTAMADAAAPAERLVPWFEARGVLASAGAKALTLPAAELPRRGVGDWALSLWLYVADGPTGAHRGVFFKGDPGRFGGHRTPSCWLLPDSNRLALRVSTVDGLDVGAETEAALETRKWTHLTFSFRNFSATGGDTTYELSLVVDGVHDSTLTFKAKVTSNDGALQVGRDPDRSGFRGMVSDVKVWPRALSRREAAEEFAETRAAFVGPAAFNAAQRDEDSAVVVAHSALAAAAWADALAATAGCEGFAVRLDTYEAAAELYESASAAAGAALDADGAAAHRRAAELLLYGAERLETGPKRCRPNASTLDADGVARAAAHLASAAAAGDAKAMRMRAVLLLGGFVTEETEAGKAHKEALSTTPSVDSTSVDSAAAARVPHKLAKQTRRFEKTLGVEGPAEDAATRAALALLMEAAALGDARACMMLSLRYSRGWGVSASVEAASWYAANAAEAAKAQYHTSGEQTHIELNRLSDEQVAELPKRQSGDEDAELRAQLDRAEAGDLNAMIGAGDLLYWGARGFERDHRKARLYFSRAAHLKSHQARCLYAAMLLRGEGGPVDHGEAVLQYEAAAADGSSKALNGLGYEYFYGNSLPQNSTRAYAYFAAAAALGADGDSLFNAAHCLDHGKGVERDVEAAAKLYKRAASDYGHFDAAFELAAIRAEGRGGAQRDAQAALKFFAPCARAGWAARDVRAGFDRYLAGDPARALLWYAEAAETGYDVAAVNAAWLLERSAGARSVLPSGRRARALRYHHVAFAGEGGAADSAAAIGDAQKSPLAALAWYSRAADGGSARGTFAMAQMHARGGDGVPRHRARARRLLAKAAEQEPKTHMRIAVAVELARLWFDELVEGWLPSGLFG